ncbi:DUF92 domain-containing protein [Paenibacillus polymyxa]|uniref:DUF92 domain-containing protein n=1 Tax=Paenibacillus polymyxa TaxID=1406 RepID=UPI001BE5CB8A|nr:DUF92 domain-containing protein [Paenibacillus polymyxa]MBT2284516.1 DUF92 domain-containing protein [Paenibacillus polymyxa]
MDWIIGAVCASMVAGAAYVKKSLTLSGCLAAIMMGTIYYGAGNLFWFGTLLLFFITSTLLSRFRKDRKQELEKSYAKSGNRDAGQVMANGGMGMFLCLGYWIFPHPAWIYAFIGVMATVTSDTWATEIGSLSRKPPRSVLTWKVLKPGASGGVSLLGTVAAAVGGALIGAGAFLFSWIAGIEGLSLFSWTFVGLVGGLAGAFADSYLGATVQMMYRCSVCGREVEVHEHCGHPTVRARGWAWMSNDLVNVLSSVIGGCVAIGLGNILAL